MPANGSTATIPPTAPCPSCGEPVPAWVHFYFVRTVTRYECPKCGVTERPRLTP